MYDAIYDLIDKIPSLPTLPDLTQVKLFLIQFINNASYFVPLPTLLIIFGLTLAVNNFAFLWKLATKIWELLPFT